MTFNLLTISTIVGTVISLIFVIAVIVIAKNVIRIKRYIHDWRLIEANGIYSWRCKNENCKGWNEATKFICEDCGKRREIPGNRRTKT